MADVVTLAAVAGTVTLGLAPWLLLHRVWTRYDAVLDRAVRAERELAWHVSRRPGSDVTVRMLPDTAPLQGLSHRIRIRHGDVVS